MNNTPHGRYAYHATEAKLHHKISKQISIAENTDLFYILLGSKKQLTAQVTASFYQKIVQLDFYYRYGLHEHIDDLSIKKGETTLFKDIAMPIISHDGYYFAVHFTKQARQIADKNHFIYYEDLNSFSTQTAIAQEARQDRQFEKSWKICPAHIDEFHQSYGFDAVRLYLLTYTHLPKSEFDYDIGFENALKFICRIWQYTSQITDNTYKIKPICDISYVDSFHQHINNTRHDLAIADLHAWANDLFEQIKSNNIETQHLYAFLSLLKIATPYLTEEILSHHFNFDTDTMVSLPQISEQFVKDKKQPIIFQINAKKCHCLYAPKGLDQKSLEDFVFADPVVQKKMKHIQIKKIITVPERVVNVLTA